jgi:hypothetical protein
MVIFISLSSVPCESGVCERTVATAERTMTFFR